MDHPRTTLSSTQVNVEIMIDTLLTKDKEVFFYILLVGGIVLQSLPI